MATGLGTPNAANLPAALCRELSPVAVTRPGNETSSVGSPVSVQIHATDTNPSTLTFSATDLPAGLSITHSGLISGTPTTTEASFVTVTARDSAGASGSTGFTWTITSVPSGALAWGAGPDGELGNGTTTSAQLTPVPVSLPAGVTATALTGGEQNGYALGSDGNVYAWGNGQYGQLGNGTSPSVQSTPVAVSLPAGVTAVSIAAGDFTGYAIGSDGNVYTWGFGADGELGNGAAMSEAIPVRVSLPAGVTASVVAAGHGGAYAIDSDGSTLYAWGDGVDGQLGNGTATGVQSTPVAVSLPAKSTVSAVASGGFTGYAIVSTNAGYTITLYAWGLGVDGELGNGTTTAIQTTPVPVSLPTG